MSALPLIGYRTTVIGTYANDAETITVDDATRLTTFPIRLYLYNKSTGTPIEALENGEFEVLEATAKDGNDVDFDRNVEGGFGAVTITGDEWEIFSDITPGTLEAIYAKIAGDPDQTFDVDTATTNDHAVPKGQMDTALALKALLAGSASQDFVTQKLTVNQLGLFQDDNSSLLDLFRTNLSADLGRWGFRIGSSGDLYITTRPDNGDAGDPVLYFNRNGNVNVPTGMYQIGGEAIFSKGVWTPAYAPSSGAFGTLTYNTRAGNWYIIGPNLIKLDFYIVTSNVVVGTAAGNILITGMPESLVAAAATKVGAITWNTGWASNTPLSISVNTSGLFRLNNGLSVVQVSDMTTGSANNNYIQGSVICEFS